jgi:FlgN protein
MEPQQIVEAQSFIRWMTETGDMLRRQAHVAESLQGSLTHLNIEQTARHLENQHAFLIKAETWYKQCWSYWIRLGYPETSGESGLSHWLALRQSEWVDDPLANQMLRAWSDFRSALLRVQELNTINQQLVEQLSNDTRRKLHALLEYSRGSSSLYTAEGGMQTEEESLSSTFMGSGRLLAKG